MRNMSFALTTPQILAQTKTVTRRFGWWFLRPGDLVQPVKKAMGLKKGERVEKLGCPIRILSTREEPLFLADTAEEVQREGFPDWTPRQFVTMICRHYKCRPNAMCNRIEFEYTKGGGDDDRP